MSDESLTELLRDMRMQVSCGDKAEMPIPLYERIKEALRSRVQTLNTSTERVQKEGDFEDVEEAMIHTPIDNTPMTKGEGLLACPYCGGGAGWNTGQHGDGTPWHYIACEDCEAMGSTRSCQREGVILDWNTRVTQPLTDAQSASQGVETLLGRIRELEGENEFLRNAVGLPARTAEGAAHD